MVTFACKLPSHLNPFNCTSCLVVQLCAVMCFLHTQCTCYQWKKYWNFCFCAHWWLLLDFVRLREELFITLTRSGQWHESPLTVNEDVVEVSASLVVKFCESRKCPVHVHAKIKSFHWDENYFGSIMYKSVLISKKTAAPWQVIF